MFLCRALSPVLGVAAATSLEFRVIFRHAPLSCRAPDESAASRKPRRAKSAPSDTEAEVAPAAPSFAPPVDLPVRRGRGRPRKVVATSVMSHTAVHGDEMTQSLTHSVSLEAQNPALELVEGGLRSAAYDESEAESSEDARIQAQYDDGQYEGDEGFANEEGEEGDEGAGSQSGFQLSSNQVLLTLSYSLLSQVRQVARMEGVTPQDILTELVAEGVTKRAFQDFQRPVPSHFMTRTGYVPPEANGNVITQPVMSHHTMGGSNQGGRRNFNGGNGGNGNFYQNGNRGNYVGNHKSGNGGNGGGNHNGNFRSNGNSGGNQKNGNVGNFRGNGGAGNHNGNQKNGNSANNGGNQKHFKQNFQRNKGNGNHGGNQGPRGDANGNQVHRDRNEGQTNHGGGHRNDLPRDDE